MNVIFFNEILFRMNEVYLVLRANILLEIIYEDH